VITVFDRIGDARGIRRKCHGANRAHPHEVGAAKATGSAILCRRAGSRRIGLACRGLGNTPRKQNFAKTFVKTRHPVRRNLTSIHFESTPPPA